MVVSAATIRTRFYIWSGMLAAMLAVLVFVAPRLTIDTDILTLLPRTRDAAVDEALERLTATLAQRQLFLVGARELPAAKRAARRFTDELSASGHFAAVHLEVSGDLRALADSYRGYGPFLLADSDRLRLHVDDGEAIFRDALRAAYTPAGMMRLLPLSEDPLGLAGNFLQQQLPSFGNARLDGSTLVASVDDRHYVLVTAQTNGSAFSEDVQNTVLPAIDAATQSALASGDEGAEVLTSGAIQHAAAATRQAKAEIGLFGTIETVAVLALLFFVFGRLQPLVLGATVLAVSIAAAVVVSHFLFGKLHIMALVFGASLIGVVIDYSMHFFADQFRLREEWTPAAAVTHVGPAILLGMVTTMVGYCGLVLMPFPGLRQIAAFCIVGILVGCGSVLCLYPYLMGTRLIGAGASLPQRGPRLAGAIDNVLRNWQWTRLKIAATALLALFAVTGWLRAIPQDDIRALQNSPLALLQMEQRVQATLGGGVETRFFLVQAADEESLLQSEEQLRERLDTTIGAGDLGSYMAISRALPSQRRQRDDHALLLDKVYSSDGVFVRALTQFGFSRPQIDARLATFSGASTPMDSATWLGTPAAAPYRHLWLGRIGERYASVVTLSGIKNVAALHQLTANLPEVRLVDRPREVSEVMSRYRHVTTWLLAFAFGAALLMLSLRFGWRDGVRLVMPSVASCLVTLGIFGWFGVAFNLFNMFALLLVLALGIDYGIFLRHGHTARLTAILSVTLSACTTLIGFGMLAFSVTPFIRSIGLTLLCGIVCSWLFVMLSCMTTWRRGEPAG